MKLRIIETGSQIASFVLNPFFVSAFTFSILVFSNPVLPFQGKIVLLFVSILFSAIIPLLYVINMKKRRVIEVIEIEEKEKRINPLVWGALSNFIGFLFLNSLNAPSIVSGLMFSYATNTIFILLITLHWKVSIHASGISGPLVALSFQFGRIVLPFYLLIAVVGGSRLVLKKHTLWQVVVGCLLGLVMTAVQLEVFFI